jgi:hypothetical protein
LWVKAIDVVVRACLLRDRHRGRGVCCRRLRRS